MDPSFLTGKIIGYPYKTVKELLLNSRQTEANDCSGSMKKPPGFEFQISDLQFRSPHSAIRNWNGPEDFPPGATGIEPGKWICY
jgi:hypothetical protein